MLNSEARRQLVDTLVYKITDQSWLDVDPWFGSDDDLRDGFVHFSAAEQVSKTLRKFFGNERDDLFLLAVDPSRLDATALRWESNGSASVYPHLYAPMPHAAVRRVSRLVWHDSAYELRAASDSATAE